MKNLDITVKLGDGYFNYRVGAIIINDNKILMVKNANYPYYYTVGGRVSLGETSYEAVLREVFEETSVNFEIERLAFIHENFFTGETAIEEGKIPFHEIAFYFIMKSNNLDMIKCESSGADGGVETLHWLPIKYLDNYEIYPKFSVYELENISNEVKHFITKNGRTYTAADS